MAAGELAALPSAATIEEVRAFLRMGADIDDPVLAGLLRSATAVCEQFTHVAIVARTVVETIPITAQWQRLGNMPVRAITSVQGVPADGPAFAFATDAYAIDIDSSGVGWVRIIQPGAAGRMNVTYEAGLVGDVGHVPDGLRQGVIMLTAHLHRVRDGEDAGPPPAAVTALWQPWRRMRLS